MPRSRVVHAGVRVSGFVPARIISLKHREQELRTVTDWILQDDVRMVSIVGAPGVGKSALAHELALRLAEGDDFPQSVSFVEYERTHSTEHIVPRIVATFDRRRTDVADGVPAFEDLLRQALGNRHYLLVLDRLEHLDGAGEILTSLLQNHPHLKIITTSREPTHVPGEYQFRLPPLALPCLDPMDSPEQLRDNPAVRMLLAAITRRNGNFVASDAELEDIARICAAMAGIPFLLELAAGWMNTHTADQVLKLGIAQLDPVPRTPAELESTWRGAMRWSYDLLDSDAARQALRRSVVFRGGFTTTPICEVAGVENVSVLGELAECSLVVPPALQNGDNPFELEGRFGMLDPVRDWCSLYMQKRDPGERAEAEAAHAAWFAGLAREALTNLRGPDQDRWLARLEAEHDNLEAALEWAARQDPPDAAVLQQIAGALWQFWNIRGYYALGWKWLRTAIDAGDDTAPELRMEVLHGLSVIALMTGDAATSQRYTARELALAEQVGDPVHAARATYMKALQARRVERYELAAGFLREALGIFEEQGEDTWAAQCLTLLARPNVDMPRFPSAMDKLREALALNTRARHLFGLAAVEAKLGDSLIDSGDLDQALDAYAESLDIRERLESPEGMADAITGLATIALRRHRNRDAGNLFGMASAWRDSIGMATSPTVEREETAYWETFPRAAARRRAEGYWRDGERFEVADVRKVIASLRRPRKAVVTNAERVGEVFDLSGRQIEVAVLKCISRQNWNGIARSLHIAESTARKHWEWVRANVTSHELYEKHKNEAQYYEDEICYVLEQVGFADPDEEPGDLRKTRVDQSPAT